MFIDDALNLVYTYARGKCDETDLAFISKELLGIAGRKNHCFEESKLKADSYLAVQNMLSKLNERESIRKSKGVYYTPCDVVRFIVANTVKASYGKLNSENIGSEDLSSIPYKAFALNRTIFDPTCGAGEYLLKTLEMKFDLLDQHYSALSQKLVHNTVSTIHGNDINEESVVIAKLRLFLLVYKRYGVNACKGLSQVLKKNFHTYDYVEESPKKAKYDIIVGNPPYVEDFKSGLKLPKKYGNIYANVLIHAAKQLSDNGSMGFIIPLSYISTPRMSDLRDELIEAVSEQYILSYADRPDCLFDSVHQKLCILIGKVRKNSRNIYTGNYQYWYKEERGNLFSRTEVVRNPFYYDECIPKLGTAFDLAVFRKVKNPNNMKSVYAESRKGNEPVYLNRRETFWMKAYRHQVDDPDYKRFFFESSEAADYCYCLINSSLFWWYWISTSDCWHVSKDLNGFMAPFGNDYTRASDLANALKNKLEETKVFVGTKQTEYEYKHRECITEIRAIDDYINGLFGLSEEESQYINNFAFRYRTSGGADL